MLQAVNPNAMNAQLPASVVSIQPIEDRDGTVHTQVVTLAVDDVEFDVFDRQQLITAEQIGTTLDAALVIFFADIEEIDGNYGIEGDDEGTPRFTGQVEDVTTGQEGFQALLDIGGRTIWFDPGGIDRVRPGDVVQMAGETVHLVGVDTASSRSRNP